jgi:hypothetical protein
MTSASAVANVEADLAALRTSAERAGTALACLFSSASEFEAEVIRVRRAQGAYAGLTVPVRPARSSPWRRAVRMALLTVTFLVL